ncbi:MULTISPECIES: hypothetical protein [Heyndrickxia]|nr:hypothetical protein [Heyndrickxia sporothermodurans]
MHNGAMLYDDPEYGGGFELNSVNDIIKDLEVMDYPKGWFPIGYGYTDVD